MFKNKHVLCAALVCASALSCSGNDGKIWSLIPFSRGGSSALEEKSAEGFLLNCRQEKGKEINVQVCGTVDQTVALKDARVVFSVRSVSGRKASLGLVLSTMENGKSRGFFGPRIPLDGTEWKNCEILLDKAFGLKTDPVRVWQIKFGFKTAGSGAPDGMEIRDFRIVPAGKVTFSQKGTRMILPEVKQKNQRKSSAAKSAPWRIILQGAGVESKFTPRSSEAFSIVLQRNGKDAPANVMLCQDLNKEFHTQNRLFFSCRSINGKPMVVHPMLSCREGGKTVLKFGPKLTVSGKAEKQFVLGIDTDFKLGDTVLKFLQLKFSVDISGAKEGEQVELDVSGMRICMPEEAGMSPDRPDVLVAPGKKITEKRGNAAADPVKIFFLFDNEDFATVFCGRGNFPRVEDRCQFPGYRSFLLESVNGQAVLADSPESADLIVYAGARPDPEMAKRVAESVREKGKSLFVAAAVADPEIEALLPVVAVKRASDRLPVRRKLKAVRKEDRLFRDLSEAAFGQYFDAKVRNGGTVRLVFEDNAPALVDGRAGKGRVIWSALGIGSDVIAGRAAEGPLLLRIASEVSGKSLREALRVPPPAENGWREGVSAENFGRFGWLIGDGLLVESMNDVFEVSNGAQQYSFKARQSPKLSLAEWSFRPLKESSSSRNVNWAYSFLETGTFEYSAVCTVPEAWKDEKISFTVEGGIDDLAEVFFNGRSIGKVTEDMPEYWRRPHRYVIPRELVKFGGENRIRIVVENLRGSGGMGSCPELICLPSKAERWTFAADRINELGKGGLITDAEGSRRFDSSLAFPGIRWEIFADRIVMGLFNVADYAAIPAENGSWKIVDLRKNDSLPVDWKEPWILLFRESECRPLLLAFAKKQDRITVSKVGSAVNGLSFERRGGVGMIVPIWLNGALDTDSSAWRNGIPASVSEKAAFWGPKAFSYPLAEKELFRIDREKGRIDIRTTYSHRTTPNDWKKTSAPFAPVSPLAFFTKGLLFESEQVKDWKMVTHFGNFAASENSDTAEWSLPLPVPQYPLVPRIEAEKEVRDFAASLFRKGILFNAGGGTREDSWTPAYPTGKEYPECRNVNAHGWLHGINQVLISPFPLEEKERKMFFGRVRRKVLEPAELYRYKSALRWREEPFSAIRYPIYFNNRHPHAIRFAEGFGSAINYADVNETAHMILAAGQMLADRHGQKDFVRANGSYFRSAARFLLVSDDWAYMASHCRESGLSATIDMLNSEYAAMMKLARIGEILEDDALRDQALYRGARRLVPTIARMLFREYAAKNGLLLYPANVTIGVGFTELGFNFRNRGMKPMEVDLYDMSQGIPQDLVPLYRKYCPEAERNYFEKLVLPALFEKDGSYFSNPAMLDILSQASPISEPMLRKALEKCMEKTGKTYSYTSDWPGITVASSFGNVLYRLYGKVRIRTAKDLEIRDFVYDPAKKVVRLSCRTGESPELVLESSLAPVDSALLRDAEGRIRIPLRPGEEKNLILSFR